MLNEPCGAIASVRGGQHRDVVLPSFGVREL
jgi:hypothetical protein